MEYLSLDAKQQTNKTNINLLRDLAIRIIHTTAEQRN